jgi:zinc-finger-containing domain
MNIQSFSELPCICPKCGGVAKQSKGAYGRKDECCGLWSWKGKPLVDRETHKARILAHESFDRLWKSKRMKRGQAYAWLKKALGWEIQPHMAEMRREDAETVRRLADAEWARMNLKAKQS